MRERYSQPYVPPIGKTVFAENGLGFLLQVQRGRQTPDYFVSIIEIQIVGAGGDNPKWRMKMTPLGERALRTGKVSRRVIWNHKAIPALIAGLTEVFNNPQAYFDGKDMGGGADEMAAPVAGDRAYTAAELGERAAVEAEENDIDSGVSEFAELGGGGGRRFGEDKRKGRPKPPHDDPNEPF